MEETHMKLSMMNRVVAVFLMIAFGTSSNALVAKEQKYGQTGTGQQNIAKQLSDSFIQIAKKATPAVVSIRTQITTKKRGPFDKQYEEQVDPFQDEFWYRFFGMPHNDPRFKAMALGSGFVISPDGYIITNCHLIGDAQKIIVTFSDGKEFPAKTIGTDPGTDIALIKIDGNNFPYLQFGNSDNLQTGELVMAIGNPLGLRSSVSTGIISGLGRNDLSIAACEEFIQTDAAINKGNSGGPLLNLDGEVIGMPTAMASTTGGSMGIGFAVPSNLIQNITKQLQATGKVTRGYIGIAPQNIDSDIADTFHLNKPEGALVAEVVKGSPADQAGVLPGDVIVKINDKPVGNSGALRNIISQIKPNDKAILTIQRGDKELTLITTVGVHPESEVCASDMQELLGVLVQEITPEIAEQLNIGNEKGVVVKYVSPNSLAAEVGLRRGMLILSVNREPVTTAADFYNKVRELSARKQILLHVKMGQTYRFMTIKLD